MENNLSQVTIKLRYTVFKPKSHDQAAGANEVGLFASKQWLEDGMVCRSIDHT